MFRVLLEDLIGRSQSFLVILRLIGFLNEKRRRGHVQMLGCDTTTMSHTIIDLKRPCSFKGRSCAIDIDDIVAKYYCPIGYQQKTTTTGQLANQWKKRKSRPEC
jgi:hypothetical protein